MTTLRITAGSLRGRRVPVPKGDVRPTSERARQAYFNIVGERIADARFLDLFAGSGIFAFEALSRGASAAVAVDRSRLDLAAISRLAGQFGVLVETVTGDIPGSFERIGTGSFDLVYADPPYDYDGYDALLAALDERAPLSDGAIVALEHRRLSSPFTVATKRLHIWKKAEYGEVWITFYSAGTAATGIASD